MNLDDLIAEAAESDLPAPTAAKRLVESASNGDRDDLVAWCLDRAPSLLAREIQSRRGTRRVQAQHPAGARSDQFALALRAGDLDALADYSLSYKVNGIDKALGHLTASDHEAVAASWRNVVDQSLMLEMVHREVAKLLRRSGKDATLSDLMPEEKYRQLIRRIAPALAIGPP